eukprot:scaffold8610_cov19-Prasinocladus_malaysianus.AAC.1
MVCLNYFRTEQFCIKAILKVHIADWHYPESTKAADPHAFASADVNLNEEEDGPQWLSLKV